MKNLDQTLEVASRLL